MKKELLILTMFVLVLCNNVSFCYSENFELLLQVMDADRTNIHGKQLNEQIYDSYSLFVYGTPLDGYAGQRFKEVPDEGKWTKNGNAWNGDGIRGEYWILRRKQRRI